MRRFCKLFAAAVLATGLVIKAGADDLADADRVNGIYVIVGDTIITYQQVRAFAAPAEPILLRQYGSQPEVYRQKHQALIQNSSETLIRRQLILQDFRASGFSIPESIIDEIVQDKIHQRFSDRVQFTKQLQQEGSTFESFRKEIRDQLIESEMTRKYVPEPIISPHKIEAYYEAHLDDFKVGDQVKLRMIVRNQSASEPAGTAKRMAEEILSQIHDGASFPQMAEIYSEGSLRSQGGATGWQDVSAMDNKPLVEAVAKLQQGACSGVIETPGTCYVVLLEERRAAHNKPLSDVREEIASNLRRSERDRLQKKWLTRLQSKTFVRYF